MRAFLYNTIVILILIIAFSCTHRIIPRELSKSTTEKYDSAAFERIYVEAIRQKLMGNSGDAMKYFDQCLKINPRSDGTHYQMAQILMSGGDMENGRKYLLKAHELDRNNIWYIMMLAGIYYQQNNIDSAIYFYEIAVKKAPDKENLKVTLGNMYSENKRFSEAGRLFEEMDEKYGINETTTMAGVRNYMKAKQYDNALEKILELINKYPENILYSGLLAEIYREKGDESKAAEIYEKLMKENPANPETQLSLCEFLKQQKRYDELISMLNIVVMNNQISKEAKIQFLGGIIEDQETIDKTGEKLIVPLMVLESYYEKDGIIELLRPELLSRIRRLDEAAERLEEIIKEEPDNYYAWEKLLLVYFDSGNFSKLQGKAELCAIKFNRSFIAKMLYATAATQNGDYTIALEELKKANILAGNNKEMILQVLTIEADVYYRMHDYEKAFKTFDEAIRMNDADITLLNNYAYYLAEQDTRLKEAEKMAKNVIEKEPENNTFLDTYGWVLYKRGKTNEAKKIFEKIIKSREKPDPEWFEHYGYILKKKKNCREAVKNWKIAVELDSTKTKLIEEIKKCEK